ncbi:MAG: DUF4070 domain-containing protein [Desulfomonile tiedjei]|uniref:DUF4070 domain-containing protein n=1 Tax=Desulfomonile tiedjei TaxID=2358 RepID=A0A9D6UZ48_9BACT|nr:DUF4070 domain-containing protein [Desulfomonile tiedjei]
MNSKTGWIDRSELRAVLITFFRQGVLYPSRFTFWKYHFGALLKFPRRLRYFISACIVGEHYYEYRQTISDELESQMAEIPSSVSPSYAQHMFKTVGNGAPLPQMPHRSQ